MPPNWAQEEPLSVCMMFPEAYPSHDPPVVVTIAAPWLPEGREKALEAALRCVEGMNVTMWGVTPGREALAIGAFGLTGVGGISAMRCGERCGDARCVWG